MADAVRNVLFNIKMAYDKTNEAALAAAAKVDGHYRERIRGDLVEATATAIQTGRDEESAKDALRAKGAATADIRGVDPTVDRVQATAGVKQNPGRGA